jgi:hypothetical protein
VSVSLFLCALSGGFKDKPKCKTPDCTGIKGGSDQFERSVHIMKNIEDEIKLHIATIDNSIQIAFNDGSTIEKRMLMAQLLTAKSTALLALTTLYK